VTPLLDTHVILGWLGGGVRLSTAQRRVLARVDPEHPALASDISARRQLECSISDN
jgi:hypothetical protein